MTDIAEPERAEPARAPGDVWKFWGTTLWGLAIIATFTLVGIAGVVAVLFRLDPGPDLDQRQLVQLLFAHGGLLFAVLASAHAGALAVVALAVRLSRVGMRSYLALEWPRPRDVLIGFAELVVLYLAYTFASILSAPAQSSTYIVDLYRGARASGDLPALLAAIAIVSPVSEELLVRGFLFRGWAASRLGPIGALLLTSLIWTGMHVGYDALALASVFLGGLWLGWIRLRGGSTPTTMVLHAIYNTAVLINVAIVHPPT